MNAMPTTRVIAAWDLSRLEAPEKLYQTVCTK